MTSITIFDAIYDQDTPADECLAEIAGALRPDGSFLAVDVRASSHVHESIHHPARADLFYTNQHDALHDRVARCWTAIGLGNMWGRQLATTMLAEAGFDGVAVLDVEDDPFNSYYVAGKSE